MSKHHRILITINESEGRAKFESLDKPEDPEALIQAIEMIYALLTEMLMGEATKPPEL